MPLYRALLLASLGLVLAACSRSDEQAGMATSDNELVQNRGADKDNWWDELPRAEWSEYPRISQDLDWFEVYLVADGIFAIYEPGQFEEAISFLVVGEERALLFDSGVGIGDMRHVVDQLTTLPVTVLNSHSHYDHIGGNHQFETIYALDNAYTKSNAQGSSVEDVAEFVSDGWIWKETPAGFDAAQYRTLPYTISKTVAEGDTFDLGGRVLEIIETPGHAPDSLCLIDRDNRLLFTGDTFYLAPLYAHLEGSNFDDYVRTAGRLAELADEVDTLLTSHNVPVVNGSYLTALGAAFDDIQSGRATDFTMSDGNYEYQFDGFSVIVRASKE